MTFLDLRHLLSRSFLPQRNIKNYTLQLCWHKNNLVRYIIIHSLLLFSFFPSDIKRKKIKTFLWDPKCIVGSSHWDNWL